MGFFSGGYTPTERDRWNMQRERERDARRRAEADAREAARLREAMFREELKAEADRRRAEQQAREQADKDAAAEEKALLSRPVTRRVGGTAGNARPIVVWHWKAEPPRAMDVKVRRSGLGPLLAIPPSGEISSQDTALYQVNRSKPWLIEQFPEWVEKSRGAVAEVKERYLPLFNKLRDDRRMGYLFHAAGITMDTRRTETMPGTYGVYSREVTERSVPTLTDVVIDPDGLTLTYAARLGDSAKRWASKLDLLATGFAAEGVDTTHLRVTAAEGGAIRLEFNDAPSAFPSVIAPEPPVEIITSVDDAIAARKRARWLIGVDARGNTIAPKIDASAPHALVVAGTGGGKSVFCRSLIESLRVGTSSHAGGAQAWQFVIADGKRTDYRSLVGQPGVLMVSNEAAQHVVAVHRVWAEMKSRFKIAEQRKDSGVPHDQAFRFPPLMLLMDEFAILRADVARLGRDSDGFFSGMIEELLRLAREVSIVVVISSQDIRVDTIDGAWQENLKLVISLGQPSARTLMSDSFGDDETKESVKRIGSRIVAPGRGVIVQKSDDGRSVVREFQSFMGWSPGATDITAAPNKDVAQAWQRAEAAAARVPRMYPRLGIEVADPEWRNGDAEQIAHTAKVVVLDGRDGPLPEREVCDPSSPKWTGRQPESELLGGHEEISFDAPSTPPPSSSDGLTAEEREAEIRRIAVEKGWLKEDDAAEPEPEPEPKKAPAKKAAPKKRAVKSAADDDKAVGEF
ncbi:hypothetical protein MOKP118_41920 [Mycobacterium avium subsp. hominissuis]